MSKHYQKASLNLKQLLAAANNNLNTLFYVSTRDSAKGTFNTIAKGSPAPFMRIDTDNESEIYCELELDSSLYVGKLNFGKFRKALAVMMLSIKTSIESDKPLNTMSSKSGEILFNIPGIVTEDDQINILVCSFMQYGPGLATIKLMYLDPSKYVDAAQKATKLDSESS